MTSKLREAVETDQDNRSMAASRLAIAIVAGASTAEIDRLYAEARAAGVTRSMLNMAVLIAGEANRGQ